MKKPKWYVGKFDILPIHTNKKHLTKIYASPKGSKYTHGYDVLSKFPLRKKEIDYFKKSILEDIEKEKSNAR